MSSEWCLNCMHIKESPSILKCNNILNIDYLGENIPTECGCIYFTSSLTKTIGNTDVKFISLKPSYYETKYERKGGSWCSKCKYPNSYDYFCCPRCYNDKFVSFSIVD